MKRVRTTIITLLVGLLLFASLALPAHAEDKVGNVIGIKTTMIYHHPDSPYISRAKEENKVVFKSAQDADAAGYKPAKTFNKNKKEKAQQ